MATIVHESAATRTSSTPEKIRPNAGNDAERKRERLAHKRWNHAMLWVRRVHLYSGLFMLPWVLLYGVTGMLFNHPAAFSDGGTIRTFGETEIAGTPLAGAPTADELAIQVVEAINLAANEGEGPRLTPPREARFSGPLSYTLDDGESLRRVEFNLETRAGTIRADGRGERPAAAKPRDALAGVNPLELDAPVVEQGLRSLPSVLSSMRLKEATASNGRTPSLLFTADADGEPVRVFYDMASGRVSSMAAEAKSPLPLRSFLLRMHTAHGYSATVAARWFWAIAVDAMFVSMVFWGLSGVFMWWQIKRTRWLGTAFLVVSAVVATTLATGMHAAISTPTAPTFVAERGGAFPPLGAQESRSKRSGGEMRSHGAKQEK